MTLILAAAIGALLAGAIAAVSGFGIGSLLTPILLVTFAPRHAVALVAIPHALASTIRLIRLWHDVDWPTFRQFGIASAVGGLTGALLQTRLGGSLLTLLLGALLLLAGGSELLGRRLPLPGTPFWRLLGGTLSGFFGGLVGNQGGIRSAALLGFRLTPRQLVATATASAVIVDLARVPVYVIGNGGTLGASAGLIAAMCAGVVVGTLAGVPLLGSIPEKLYRRLIGGLLILLGLSLVIAAL